jgi:hypothetical protein
LFMSMRSAASVCQLWQESSFPRGARMTRGVEAVVVMGERYWFLVAGD